MLKLAWGEIGWKRINFGWKLQNNLIQTTSKKASSNKNDIHINFKKYKMENSSLTPLIILAIIGFVWLLPILSIIFSRKTTGSEKLAWILAVIFISWFAWIFYLLIAPVKKK